MAMKPRVLYLMQYLEQNSDEQHPVTTAEIRKELSAQVKLIQGMDKKADEAAYDAAVEKAVELTKELDQASKIEAAQQRLAERQLANLEKEAGRAFSFAKFIRELAEDPEGRKLTGIEALLDGLAVGLRIVLLV